MRAAILLGERERGRTWPNPAVGALVVRDGVVIGRGWTKVGGRPHAERVALAEAGEAARGATLYVSLEPCSHHGRTPPCADAIVEAGIARVVSAIRDPNPLVAGQGYARLRSAGIEVREDVLLDRAAQSHAGHFTRFLHKRPYVTLKLAVSTDGKAAFKGRKPAPITAENARKFVHMMRAQHDAIAVGIGTVIADDPLLTCRLPGMIDRSPVRVVFDPHLQLPPSSALVETARQVPVWLVVSHEAPSRSAAQFAPHGIETLRVSATEGGVNLVEALHAIAEHGITRLMLEGGVNLASAFLEAGLVDEAVILESPQLLGADAVDALPADHRSFLPHKGLKLVRESTVVPDHLYVYERM